MKSPRIAIATFVVGLTLWSNVHCAQARHIDRIIESFLCPQCAGVVVGVVRNETVVLRKGYGPADMARHIPVQPDTVFDLASLSKQFTGAAIMILAQRGQLSLDDDVSQHLREIPDDVPSIKLRHLSQHTSGLPEFPGGATLQTESARSTWLSHLRVLEFPPGGGWAYRNSNYYLLARVVERVSGNHFRTFLQKEIFDPVRMKNAQVLDSPDGVIRNRATGYCFGSPCRQDDGFTGAGGVFASLDDMIAWDAALRNDPS